MIKIKELKQTCLCFPSQWEGSLETGESIYIRYRWGRLSVRTSFQPSNDIIDAINGNEILSITCSDALDGCLSKEGLIGLTKSVIEYPDGIIEDIRCKEREANEKR